MASNPSWYINLASLFVVGELKVIVLHDYMLLITDSEL